MSCPSTAASHPPSHHVLCAPTNLEIPRIIGLSVGRQKFERTRNQVLRASRPWKGHRKTDLLSVREFKGNPETKQVMYMKLRAGTAFRHNFRKLCRFVVTSSACDKVQIRINIGPVLHMRAHSSTVPVTPLRHNSRSIDHFFLERTQIQEPLVGATTSPPLSHIHQAFTLPIA